MGCLIAFKGRLAGAKVYLTKPFKTQDLLAVVQSSIGFACRKPGRDTSSTRSPERRLDCCRSSIPREQTPISLIPLEGAEIARLMKQSQLLTRSMGGVFPELGDELTHMHSILDLACGPGRMGA